MRLKNKGEHEITSSDEKTAKLESKYGSKIFGIQQDKIEKPAQAVKERFIDLFKIKIKL